jgi:ActD protein
MTPTERGRAVYALFEKPEAVQHAVDGLRAVMVPEREIVVMSSEPIEEFEFSQRYAATWMPWIAAIGGALGLTGAIALLVATQNAWPIVTSGMPIVAWWPNTIIMFELTMLGAILATVISLVVTAVRPRRLSRLYDREVSDGYILVGVEDAEDGTAVADVLASAGGRVKNKEPSTKYKELNVER